MKKLTKSSLDELALIMPIIHPNEMRCYIGGGDGTQQNPYTYDEFFHLASGGSWHGGWVEDAYMTAEVDVVGSSGKKSGDNGYSPLDPDIFTGYAPPSGDWSNPDWLISGSTGYYPPDLGNHDVNVSPGGGGTGGVNLTPTPLQDFWKFLKGSAADLITGSAEIAHNIYERVSVLLKQNPGSANTINSYLDEIKKMTNPIVAKDPDQMGWGDLFNIWLFELKTSNMGRDDKGNIVFTFYENAQTTKDLQTQEGVSEARDKVVENIKKGDLSTSKTSWTYGQDEFYDGVKEMNTATSFLGSYATEVKITDNHNGTYTLNYTVSNSSGWESATRLRKDNDHNGTHDAIIPDSERGAGVSLGGTIKENWIWSETIKIK